MLIKLMKKVKIVAKITDLLKFFRKKSKKSKINIEVEIISIILSPLKQELFGPD